MFSIFVYSFLKNIPGINAINNIIDIKDEFYIYTKGDANKEYDKYKITKDMVIGVVKFKIPFIGYPTVLLNEKW